MGWYMDEVKALRYILKIMHDITLSGESLVGIGRQEPSTMVDPFLRNYVKSLTAFVESREWFLLKEVVATRLEELGYEVGRSLAIESDRLKVDELLDSVTKQKQNDEEEEG